MKKFMTLLLVVSVLFTFSFSSAFAAVSVDEAGMNAVLEQQEKMAEAVNKYAAEKVVYDQNGYVFSPEGYANVPKAAVEAAVAEVIATLNQEILAKEIELVATVTEWTQTETDALAAVWAGDMKAKVFEDKTDNALYTVAVEAYAAAFSAKVEAVDPEAYTGTIKTAVKAAVEAAKAALKEPVKNATGLKALVDAEKDFDAVVEHQDNMTAAEQEAKLEEAKAKAVEAVKAAYTKHYEDKKAILEATIEANTSPEAVVKATADLAVLAENVDKVEALHVGRIEAVAITETVDYAAALAEVATLQAAAEADVANIDSVVAQFNNVELLVKFAETAAATKKTQYDTTTGLATYNAETVDKVLAEVIADIEALKITDYTAVANEFDAIKTAVQEKAALKTQIENGVKDITEGTYDAALWADENKEAVEAIQKDYKAQIEAAKTADEITELVKAAKKAMDAYLNIAQTDAVKTAVVDAVEAGGAKSVKSALTAYAEGVAAKNAGVVYTTEIKGDAVAQAVKVFVDAAVALQDANIDAKTIEAIIDANYEAALAVIDGMKTADELDAEAKAVVEAIKALPTTATLENKAEFLAAKDMFDAYMKNAGASEAKITNYSLLKSQLTKIVRLEKDAVVALVKALPKNITLADKEAVEAAKAAVEAYDEAYKTFTVYGYVATGLDTQKATLTTAETTLDNIMKLEAAKLIAALPADITAADAEAVAAARAAYDALSKDAKADFDNYSDALVKKLVAAEETLAALTAYTDADAKAYVQDLKIVARSAKTAKGSVKVTINADVEELIENGYTVEYKFYRSTKSNAKFGTAKKVSEENVYTNTTGKKGVKYFYKAKLVVKNAEGEVVATTPLTQCRYACRTWSK